MYEQEITGRHKSAFVIAVDTSKSMCEPMTLRGGKTVVKADAVARAVNTILTELVDRANREGEYRDYYDIAVLGYGNGGVRSLIGGWNSEFIPVAELARRRPEMRRSVADIESDSGERIAYTTSSEEWIAPQAGGDTPMYEAFDCIRVLLKKWCADPRNRESFPPVVINITDGEASDCDPAELRDVAGKIKELGTLDGNVLLFNIHIASDTAAKPVLLPSESEIDRDNRYASLLADCSSRIPEPFERMIMAERGGNAAPPFVAMSYNASMVELLSMLDIGSRSVTDIR